MGRSKRTRSVLLIAVVAAFAGAPVTTGNGPTSAAVDHAGPAVTAHGHGRSAHARDVALTRPAGGPSWGSHVVEHELGGVPAEEAANRGRGALYRTGEIASEPTLGLTSDGTILYQLWTAEGLPVVGRSPDGGRSWDYVLPSSLTDATDGSFDPYLYVDPVTDRVFSVNHLAPTPGQCHDVAFSDEAGDDWSSSLLCGQLDHQTLFAGPPVSSALDPDVYPNVVYLCSAQVPPGANFSSLTTCQRSLDGGRTFVPTGEPAYVGIDPEADTGDFGIRGFCGGLSGHGVVGPDGTVYVPRTYCGRPFLAISRDEGARWERVEVADNGTAITSWGQTEHDAGVAVDADGNLYYTWIARDRLPYLAVSTDGGTTWSEPLMVGTPGVVEASSAGAIDVGTPGRVAIAYLGSENSPGPPFDEIEDCTGALWAPCVTNGYRETSGSAFFPEPEPYGGVTWNGYLSVVVDALGPRPTLFSAAVNDPDEPFIRGTCDAHRCKGTFEFIDVVIGPDGVAWGAYVDVCAAGDCWGMLGEGVVARLFGVPRLR